MIRSSGYPASVPPSVERNVSSIFTKLEPGEHSGNKRVLAVLEYHKNLRSIELTAERQEVRNYGVSECSLSLPLGCDSFDASDERRPGLQVPAAQRRGR